MIDLPDFGTSLNRIAESTEKIAGTRPDEGVIHLPSETTTGAQELAQAPGDASETPAEPRQGDVLDAPPTRSEIAPLRQREPTHA
jgi:hypothetical protein